MQTTLSEITIKRLYYLAVLSFVFGLFIPILGEEGVYTITSLEMLWHHEYSIPLFYGTFYMRPPLYNWLMIAFIKLFGIKHVLIGARFIAALATIGTSVVMVQLVKSVWGQRTFAYFAGLTYLVTDALRYHGWLAYADPLFSFFIFSGMAALYYATHRQKSRWLILSLFAIAAAFLTKALTAYIFYGVAFIVLWLSTPACRQFLLRWQHLLAYAITLSFPLLWQHFTHGNTGSGMVVDIFSRIAWPKASWQSLVEYVRFAFETLLRLSPPLLLVIYYAFKHRITWPVSMHFFLWVAVINYLPYFLDPNHEARYFLPLYPVISIYLAACLWGVQKPNAIGAWYGFSIALKYLFVLLLPIYLSYEDAPYPKLAQTILASVGHDNLYVTDVVASGLSTTYYLDLARTGQAPLTLPPARAHGWVISQEPGLPDKTRAFSLGRSAEQIYLVKI